MVCAAYVVGHVDDLRVVVDEELHQLTVPVFHGVVQGRPAALVLRRHVLLAHQLPRRHRRAQLDRLQHLLHVLLQQQITQ